MILDPYTGRLVENKVNSFFELVEKKKGVTETCDHPKAENKALCNACFLRKNVCIEQ